MKSVTRKLAVVGGEVTIIKQIERVDYQDERTGRFISVQDIQEVGREADYWEHLGNLAIVLVGDVTLAEVDETLDGIQNYLDGDDEVVHDMWKTHVAQVA